MDKTALRKGNKKKQTPAEALLTTSISKNQNESSEETEVKNEVIQEVIRKTEVSEPIIIVDVPEKEVEKSQSNLESSENLTETKFTTEKNENQVKTEIIEKQVKIEPAEVTSKAVAPQKSENGFNFNVNIKVPIKEEICSVRKQIVIKPSVNEKVNRILKSKNMSFNFLINQFLETFVEENEIKNTKQKN